MISKSVSDIVDTNPYSDLDKMLAKYGISYDTMVIDEITWDSRVDDTNPSVSGTWYMEKKYGGMDMLDSQRYVNRVVWDPRISIYKDGKFPTCIDIKDVKFNDPATIVFWNDGTKTVVKAVDEPFDPEKGLSMAICKKVYGNKGNYFNKLKKWLPEEGSNKSCVTCIHEGNNQYCAAVMCLNKSAWEGTCLSCMHLDVNKYTEPCVKCVKHNKWEAQNDK